MDLHIFSRSYNSFGGTPEFQVVEALFDQIGMRFGSAVRRIEFVLCLASRTGVQPRRSLETMFETFHNHTLLELPSRTFRRKKGLLEIATGVDFLNAQDLIPEKQSEYQARVGRYLYDRQLRVGQLLVSEIEACRQKFKASDDLDFGAFIDWVRSVPSSIPKEKAEADVLIGALSERRRERREKLSPWERLDIDWDEFHPRAKALVPDHRLWSSVDDFSPNGNDTGSDVLALVQEHASDPSLLSNDGRTFYRTTWEEWGFSWPPVHQPSNDVEYNTHREFVVGLAFSFLKVLGKCPPWLRVSALDEIAKYRAFLEDGTARWEHFEEAMTMLALMHSTLSAE